MVTEEYPTATIKVVRRIRQTSDTASVNLAVFEKKAVNGELFFCVDLQ